MKTALCLLALLIWCGPTIAAVTPTPDSEAWQTWSPRDEIAPEFARASETGPADRAALRITARHAAEFGAWRTTIPGLNPGQVYRFSAWYRTTGVEHVRRSVISRLQWLDTNGRPVRHTTRPPEFPLDVAHADGWSRVELATRAPDGAAALDVQLSLGFTAAGTVWWDRIALEEIESLPTRPVRVMTVHHRPRQSPSPEASVAAFARIVRAAAPAQRPDIVCLPEGVTVVGTSRSYIDVSEPVPGPTTEQLGALARELRAYVVAGVYERVGSVVYNTAVLLDREGRFAGRYRKTHLPREEWEAGLTPGNEYPVFQTDFGTLGLLVCWDLQFPEPWRAVGRQGAQLILLPTWGGNETLLRARAIENHAYVVSSSYDMKTCIVAPDGKILVEATKETPAVTAVIDLDEKIYQPWLGDMRNRTWKEHRIDLGR